MAGFFKNLFKQEGNPGWGKALLGGALQGIGSGQGLLPGIASGVFGKLLQKNPEEGMQGSIGSAAGILPNMGETGGNSQMRTPGSMDYLPESNYPTTSAMPNDFMYRRRAPYLKF